MTTRILAQLDDAGLEALALAEEERGRDQTVLIGLSTAQAIALAGLIQLACRHPSTPPAPRAAGTRFVAALSAALAHRPATREIIRRGWDPAHDAATSPPTPLQA